MAKMVKQALGEFRGKLGGIVGKIRDGKHYISTAPGRYKISMASHEVDKRTRFRVNGQLARVIRESGHLFRVWDKCDVKANNAYNRICKLNFKRCEPLRPSANNIITPPGFWLPVTDIKVFPDRVEAEIEAFEILPEEERIVPVLIVSFYEPKFEADTYFTARWIKNCEQDGLKFIFRYMGSDEVYAGKYNHATIYLAAVTEDAEGRIVRWSSTASRDF